MYGVNRNAHTILVKNPEEKKTLRRPWLMGIILKRKLEISWNVVDWSNLDEDTNIWQTAVKA
jgi:hypothetical protein